MKITSSSGITYMVHIHHTHEHQKNRLPKSKTVVAIHAGACVRDAKGRCTNQFADIGEARVNYVAGDVFDRFEGATKAFRRAFEGGIKHTLSREERSELWKSFFKGLAGHGQTQPTELEEFIADIAARFTDDGIDIRTSSTIAEVAQTYGISAKRFDELAKLRKKKAA